MKARATKTDLKAAKALLKEVLKKHYPAAKGEGELERSVKYCESAVSVEAQEIAIQAEIDNAAGAEVTYTMDLQAANKKLYYTNVFIGKWDVLSNGHTGTVKEFKTAMEALNYLKAKEARYSPKTFWIHEIYVADNLQDFYQKHGKDFGYFALDKREKSACRIYEYGKTWYNEEKSTDAEIQALIDAEKAEKAEKAKSTIVVDDYLESRFCNSYCGVTPEAFEVAVQAEIDNAAEIEKDFETKLCLWWINTTAELVTKARKEIEKDELASARINSRRNVNRVLSEYARKILGDFRAYLISQNKFYPRNEHLKDSQLIFDANEIYIWYNNLGKGEFHIHGIQNDNGQGWGSSVDLADYENFQQFEKALHMLKEKIARSQYQLRGDLPEINEVANAIQADIDKLDLQAANDTLENEELITFKIGEFYNPILQSPREENGVQPLEIVYPNTYWGAKFEVGKTYLYKDVFAGVTDYLTVIAREEGTQAFITVEDSNGKQYTCKVMQYTINGYTTYIKEYITCEIGNSKAEVNVDDVVSDTDIVTKFEVGKSYLCKGDFGQDVPTLKVMARFKDGTDTYITVKDSRGEFRTFKILVGAAYEISDGVHYRAEVITDTKGVIWSEAVTAENTAS